MKRIIEYLIVVAFIIIYASALLVAYALNKDDPESLTLSICAISMTVMPITMILCVIFMESSKRDAIREYDEKHSGEHGKGRP